MHGRVRAKNFSKASAAGAAGVIALAALAGGCSSGSGKASKAPIQQLTARDFAEGGAPGSPASRIASTPPAASASPAQPSPAEVIDINGPQGSQGAPLASDPTFPAGAVAALDLVGTPGAPTLSDQHPGYAGSPVFVDAKIGDINGKPIYASTFFDTGSATQTPLGQRLAARAAELPRDKWEREASEATGESLYTLVRDELLRAEALSNLSTEQKQGFFAFIQSLQEDLRRESGGSREAARRRIQETEGLSSEAYERRREELELIRYQLGQRVSRRVNVSWRDITQAYSGSMSSRFHQPPTYRFRVVMVGAKDAAKQADVSARVQSGENFEAIATSPVNEYRRDSGGLEERVVKDGDAAKTEFFPSEELNTVAHTLRPGETSAPITVGGLVAWVHLEAITQVDVSLYDAQLDIEDALRRRRFDAEMRKYVDRLLSRASVTSMTEMRDRLMQIARERYLPATAPQPR